MESELSDGEQEDQTSTSNSDTIKLEIRRSLYIIGLSILIGIIAGLGGVLFILAIELIEKLFYEELSQRIGSVIYLLAPFVGGLITSLITLKFPELRGDGVPNVIYAVHFKNGEIKEYVGPVKAIASAVTIGSGGSAGREGAIVQIGASFASALAVRTTLDPRDKELLTVVGVSAGISSAFDAPLSGMLFGLEIVLLKYSVNEMVPVVLASVISAGIAGSILGPERFISTITYKFALFEFPFYLALGFALGIIGAYWEDFFYIVERFFEENIIYPIRPAIGGLLVGIIGIIFYMATGDDPLNYGILGAGVSGIQLILSGLKIAIWFFLLLAILKIITTALTVGSGGAGGVFYPTLFIGAAFGGFFGGIFHIIDSEISVGKFALLGMSALFSAVAGCPFTMSILVIEISGDLNLLPASMVVSFTSYFVAIEIERGKTIYTKKEFGGRAMDITLFRLRELKRVKVYEVMKSPLIVIGEDEKVWKAIEIFRRKRFDAIPVVNKEGEIIGFVNVDTLLKTTDYNESIKRIMLRTHSIDKDATLFDAMMLMRKYKTNMLTVKDDGKIIGIIDKDSLLEGLMIAAERESITI